MKYLSDNGWTFHRLQDTCPFCYTIADFASEHPQGKYILATGTHVVCVIDGNYYDTWESGDETVAYFWTR